MESTPGLLKSFKILAQGAAKIQQVQGCSFIKMQEGRGGWGGRIGGGGGCRLTGEGGEDHARSVLHSRK